jgi:hypothetical protein
MQEHVFGYFPKHVSCVYVLLGFSIFNSISQYILKFQQILNFALTPAQGNIFRYAVLFEEKFISAMIKELI